MIKLQVSMIQCNLVQRQLIVETVSGRNNVGQLDRTGIERKSLQINNESQAPSNNRKSLCISHYSLAYN